MAYLEVSVRTAMVVHGYDEDNRAIIERVDEPEFMRKLVAIERIQSLSDDYLLVNASHGRVMYWEYHGEYADIKGSLARAGLVFI
jgi:hypothetical protein